MTGLTFAISLPWWAYLLAFAVAIGCAWWAYARVVVPLTTPQRAALIALRAITLILIVVCLLRPVTFVPIAGARDSVVAILVDGSRSMRIADADGPRIDRARALATELQKSIGTEFKTEVMMFGESLARADIDRIAPDARRSDLSGALTALADRYKGQRLGGVVLLSDGGDTSASEAGTARVLEVPVFAVGIGAPAVSQDREVVNMTAGEPVAAESSIDLSVAVTSVGFGTTPVPLRLSENGRPLETRQVTPTSPGAPIHEVFTVSPSPDTATVYAIEIPVAPGELVAENNIRRVLVPPQGRRRRILVVEGAPGFEHTFLKRALARDPALEVDSVVRKGQNDEGRDTFFIQAAASRSAGLASGYPATPADLFVYDAIVFGNIEGDFFSREQLQMPADFVARRGGGLMVLGARSFERAGLVGTALEEVLPVDLTDRRGGVTRTGGSSPAPNAVALTTDGAGHPATRLALTPEDNRKRWSQLPPMASTAAAGAPRPGAQVLAVTSSGGADLQPLLVTQRYGVGRSMIFAGEATWRWRMLLPSSNTTHELVWRQLTRWLATGSAERIEIPPTSVVLPGTTDPVSVLVRDETFKAVAGAEVSMRVRDPNGQERTLPAALADPRDGRYTAAVRFDQPGVYTVAADVRRGLESLGTVSRPLLVGGSDVELSEPRLNEDLLRRISEASGGRYVAGRDAARVPELLRSGGVGNPPVEMRDLWNTGWTLAAIVALLGAEWLLRRRAGLA